MEVMAALSLSASQRILILHAGGLGDLVLSSNALSSLVAKLSGRHVTFCCRRDFAQLTSLWPFSFDRLIEIDFDPYVTVPRDASRVGNLDDLLRAVREDEPDTLLSLELAPTWLTPVLAALIRPRVSLARKHRPLPRATLSATLEHLELSPFDYGTYEAADNRQEALRYASILELVDAPSVSAEITIGPDAIQAARSLLGPPFGDGRSVLGCFPLGNHHVPAKRWPIDRHVELIVIAVERYGLTPVLFGDETEKAELHGLAQQMRERGIEVCVVTGIPESLEVIAATLTLCGAFIGNDTGLAHLAAALGTPGVTIYGGGTWPSFEPWAAGTVGVVNPLPCFGCGWDCAFERSLCLEAIEVEDAAEALDLALSSVARPVVVALQHRSSAELETISSASATYRVAQADRSRRFDIILELQASLREADRLARLRRDLLLDSERERSQADAERTAEIAGLELEIERLRAELKRLKLPEPGNLDVGVDGEEGK